MFPRPPSENAENKPFMEAAGIEPAQDSPGYVYTVLRESDGFIKIGTTRNLDTRLRQLGNQHGDILLLNWFDGDRAEERRLHQVYADECVGGEWFDSWRLYFDALDDLLQVIAAASSGEAIDP